MPTCWMRWSTRLKLRDTELYCKRPPLFAVTACMPGENKAVYSPDVCAVGNLLPPKLSPRSRDFCRGGGLAGVPPNWSNTTRRTTKRNCDGGRDDGDIGGGNGTARKGDGRGRGGHVREAKGKGEGDRESGEEHRQSGRITIKR